ncbi:Ribosomal protein S17 [Spironucleus salmonicida]|uniref:Ribosomal protein S17 n=1 Tax=Spironucleus salmonicida TaxID=348837 RepID=V6LNW4_9EUKA|nr:Ribosomal protein S17 [Spironucleus salmonicida]|eukprot:EST46290.1 Ribosomal protein S17 [Spironucleus salmonicida]
MAKIRTKTVKRASRKVIEAHFNKLSHDYTENKKAFRSNKIAKVQTKRLRNKIVGYTTRLMVRLQKGPINGISLKLQEEERERRDNYVPERSLFEIEKLTCSEDTYQMTKHIGFTFTE